MERLLPLRIFLNCVFLFAKNILVSLKDSGKDAPLQHFLLDSNIYRSIAENLAEKDIVNKAREMSEAEKAKGFQSLCSVVVASELISHLVDGDPVKANCYKALCLLRYHTFNESIHTKRVIAYPMENVLTRFFLCKNFVHFDSFNEVVRLMELITERLDINDCSKYKAQIQSVKDTRLAYRKGVVDQADLMLKEQGLDWGSFTISSFRANPLLEAMNKQRLKSHNLGEDFYRMAKILIDKTYESEGFRKYPPPCKRRISKYLETYQAPLRMFHYLLKKIGEAPGMQNFMDKRWNTLNDVSILFGFSDDTFKQTLLVTDDDLLFECVLTTEGMKDRVGKLSQYLSHIGITK